jgi:AraC-like DNA-binding protein
MISVSTIDIYPAAVLRPFIRCYTLRTFNTGNEIMPRPLYALDEFYFTFYLKDKFCYVLDICNNIVKKWSSTIYSLFTESTDTVWFKGDFIMFCVRFKPNGFFSVFGIPQRVLTNALLPIDNILGNDAGLLIEQLESSKDVYEMGELMNNYLTKKMLLQKHSNYTNTIAHISNTIIRNKGVANIDALAYSTSMSLRTLERRFSDEVGMPMKLLARISRFNNAVNTKMLHPEKNWTTITYECGYYDQMHMIKDFKEFSSKTPEELFKYTPPPTEKFLSEVEI